MTIDSGLLGSYSLESYFPTSLFENDTLVGSRLSEVSPMSSSKTPLVTATSLVSGLSPSGKSVGVTEKYCGSSQ